MRVATDPRLDQHDRDGRTLAYLWKGASLVNLRLVREGDAAPYFYDGDKGRYAAQIFAAAVAARKAGKGLWGTAAGSGAAAADAGRLDRAGARHEDVVLGLQPQLHAVRAELARAISTARRSATRSRSSGSDVYNLDSNGDGYGCESYE